MKTQTLFVLLFLGLCSCSKEDTGMVTFYMAPYSGTWNLIIDGTTRGLLDETTQAPVCDDVDFITLELSIGTHTYDLKDNDGYAWGSNPRNFTVGAGCKSLKCNR